MFAELKDRVLEIMDLAYDINLKGDDDCFVDLSPHANWMTVQLYNNHWQRDAKWDVEWILDLDGLKGVRELEDCMVKMDECIDALKDFLKGAK